MANGTAPPIGRTYDLTTARHQLSQTLAKLASIEPQSELEQLVKQAMRETAELLEAGHAMLALQESMCQRLWTHLDGLGAHMRRCQELRRLRHDITEQAAESRAEGGPGLRIGRRSESA